MDKPNKTLDTATIAVETAALSIGETVTDAGGSVARGARKIQKAIVVAKDAVVDKVEHPSRTLQEVKEWGADKATMVDQTLDKAKEWVEAAGETLQDMREWSADKAQKVDETLGLAQDVVIQTGETIDAVQNWGAEKALAAGHLIEKTQESLEKQTFEPAALQAAQPEKAAQPDKAAPVQMEELIDAKP